MSRCTDCGFDNREGMRFCGHCGHSLGTPCPRCGGSNPEGYRFCGSCGAGLEGADFVAPDGGIDERRQLTVMFCDLVGSTRLSEELDPEELREVVRGYQRRAVAVIDGFEGHIAQYLGDGLLVYFGYPQAYEDAARRALDAGLEICRRGVGEVGGRPLQVRVGVHSGEVVTGIIGDRDQAQRLALGKTPNIAARLQQLAAPGTVVCSAHTEKLARGYFRFESLGEHRLKGLAVPLRVYRTLEASQVSSRFELELHRGLPPLVDREAELQLLVERSRRAEEGSGQAVVLRGGAGIGKSRVVYALRQALEGEALVWRTCRCSPYSRGSAFQPVIELLGSLCRWQRQDDSKLRLSKLCRLIQRCRLREEEALPLLAELLSLSLTERFDAVEWSPERKRERLIELVVLTVLRLCEEAPLALVVEDLHWIDPSTLELLEQLVASLDAAPLLTLFTCRTEFSCPWTDRSNRTSITLDSLSEDDVSALILGVARGKKLPAELLSEAVARTDGVPLFAEELTKAVLESELVAEHEDRYELLAPLPELAVPSTLQDSLMARLDRLAAAKPIAQFASVLGREFSYEVLAAIAPMEEAALQRGLDQLVDAELLLRRGAAFEGAFIFRHALIQNAAYGSLLRAHRQSYHRQVAEVLTDRFPEVAATQPELVARHYTEGSCPDEAISYWTAAGRRAMSRSANAEAIGHLNQGLALLERVRDRERRERQELDLQTALAAALTAAKTYAAPEVQAAYGRARELCLTVGQDSQLAVILRGLFGYYLVRSRLAEALELAEQLLTLGSSLDDGSVVMAAHVSIGTVHFYAGRFSEANEHLARALGSYALDRERHPAANTGHDIEMAGYLFHGLTLWFLGRPEAALEARRRGYEVASQIAHPFSQAFALTLSSKLGELLGDAESVQRWTKQALSLARQWGFAWWRPVNGFYLSWAEAGEGDDPRRSALEMRREMDAYVANGGTTGHTHMLGVQLQWALDQGWLDDARDLLTEGYAAIEATNQRYYEAELKRLEGELELASPSRDLEVAAQCFAEALEIARRQRSLALELRAAVSLGRLHADHQQVAQGGTLVREVYERFEEGFETRDLRVARGLIERCAAR